MLSLELPSLLTLTGEAALMVVVFDALLVAAAAFDGDCLRAGEEREDSERPGVELIVLLLFNASPFDAVVMVLRTVAGPPALLPPPLITVLVLAADEDAVKLTGFSLIIDPV